MEDDTWLKLYRRLLKSPIFENEKALKIWIWCLLKATHIEREQLVGQQIVHLEKGQFVFGREKASEELGMTESTVYKYIKLLEKLQMISINSNNKFSIVSIEKWEDYQDKKQQKNNKVTTKEQQSNTNKNVKNVKNIYYGEYGNVFFTEKQYKDLQKEFPQDYKYRIQQLDDYIQSTGKKYKDCLATIRTWARKDGYVKPIEKKEIVYVENTMTEEEYFAKVRGLKNV